LEQVMFTFVRICLDLAFAPSRKPRPPFHLFSLASRLEADCRCLSLHEELYDRRLPDDPLAVKRFQKPSPPVILAPPVMGQVDGDDVARLHQLDLVLVGNSAVHAGSLVVRIADLLERNYGATVQGICLAGAYHQQQIAYDDLKKGEPFPLSIVTLDDLTRKLDATSAGKGIRLRFHTPLRLIRQGMILQRPGGVDILRSLLRRVSSLGYHYCRYEFPVDYRYLSAMAAETDCDVAGLRWHDGGRRGGEGVMGEVLFRGELEPFLPFLAAGSVVHLGKGAAGGYGRYEALPVV
jgi:hypothetical protein